MNASPAEELRAIGSATLGESGARRMHHRVKPAWLGASVAGPAVTAKCGHADNLAIHVAVARCETPGAVLVVDASNPPEFGYWGEVLTTSAEARSMAGLVIDGGCRDVGALQSHGFPVFSALIALAGAAKITGGTVGKTVRVGEVDVSPGDWIVGDVDGVVVIPSAGLDDVLRRARDRVKAEQEIFVALREGATTVELLNLDPSGLDHA
ncbi:MAG: dimethylmenaquinone methyltransferase [Actinobacteria bacterium]|nr:dimethylmenaquinone methyltransferase [Actinomycetota bacterium]